MTLLSRASQVEVSSGILCSSIAAAACQAGGFMRPKVPTAREIMTHRLVTLRPEMRIVEAADRLLEHKISGAPVVDDDEKLLGLLSEYDCLRAVAASEYNFDDHDAVVTVGEMMTTTVHTVDPETDLFAIAHEFLNLRVRRLPVVEAGRLIGQVSRRDALRAACELRQEAVRHKQYPDYPEGRAPIRNYPRGR
jgi:CBS domain-containing protein